MSSDGQVKAKGEIYFYDNFWKRLEKIARDSLKAKEALGWKHEKTYELDTARTDEKISGFPEDGDCIVVLSLDGSAEIKLDSPNADSFDLEVVRRIRQPFEDLYLTNTAQAGKVLKLLIGKGGWDLEETTPTVELSGLLQQENLAQITDPEKLADSIIRAAKIATHAVEAAKIAENAITETKIADDSIKTPHLKANIVTAAKIAAETITGSLIASNVIAARHLIAGIITAAKIATGTITADKYAELRNTIVFMDHDSLDDSYPFELPFEIVSEMTEIVSVKLSFDITNFRAYATGVPSGGGHTTPSGGGHTTPSGGGSTSGAQGSASGGGSTSGSQETPGGGGSTSGSQVHSHPGSTASGGTHGHGINAYVADTGETAGHQHTYQWTSAITMDSGSHTHSLDISDDGAHTHSTPDHTHPSHTHSTPNHTHPNHTHSTPSHQHTVSNHQHTVSNHTHALTFGIYEDPQSPTVNVYIDNGDGYSEDPIGEYTTDQLDIDISDHISGVGHKRVKFTTDKRTKIHAWVMTKVDLTA